MGLFNRKKKTENERNVSYERYQTPSNFSDRIVDDPQGSGYRCHQYEFIDDNYDRSKYYDTTRLIVQSQEKIAGKTVYNCLVSWYDQTDTTFFDKDTKKPIGRFNDYKSVRLEMDMNQFYSDPNYRREVMNDLLDRKRVTQKYLEEGLNGTRECGNYVGGVYSTQTPEGKRYTKYFDPRVGKAVHYSPEMTGKRQDYFAKARRQNEERIRANEDKIRELQQENRYLHQNSGRY